MSNDPLRLATAKAVQQYRRTKLLPIYDAGELKEVVEAWMPVLTAAGVKPAYMTDLWVFALMRRTDDKKPFGAEDIGKAWPEFINRKKAQAYQDYLDSLDDAGPDEVRRAGALNFYEKRIAEMTA